MGNVVRIAMVAGEASGDLLASLLIGALKARLPDAVFYGIGGPRMQAQGFDAWWPIDKLSVVLVAVFGERESQAVYFLHQQNVSRLDVVNYLSHGVSKTPGEEDSDDAGEPHGNEEGPQEARPRTALEAYAANLNELLATVIHTAPMVWAWAWTAKPSCLT